MKNKENVYDTYEKISDWYDNHRNRMLLERPYLDLAISYLKHDATILDLGCGTGEPIAKYFIDKGYDVTGIDGSQKLIQKARERVPEGKFSVSDMRNINFEVKFDCIIAWHSFFHLSQDDQRKMFLLFEKHIQPNGILMFTSGIDAGETWSDNGGEDLYHASLDTSEYQGLLTMHHFELIKHALQDKDCGGATIWVAKYRSLDLRDPHF